MTSRRNKFGLQLNTKTAYDPLDGGSRRRKHSRAVDTDELGLTSARGTPGDKRFRALIRRANSSSSSSSSSSGSGSLASNKRPRRQQQPALDRNDIAVVSSAAPATPAQAEAARDASAKLFKRILLQPAISSEIEEACFAVAKSQVDDAYRAHVRMLAENLRSNSKLLEAVRSGDISPAALALMKPEELASTELQQQRAEHREESKHQGIAPGTESTDYQCPSCNAYKCTYYVQSMRRDIGKSETWGNKEAASALTIRLECSLCSHQWVRNRF